jgi:3-phenylpropionate/trans-cinnamate dioxygenase ferredoxin reductase subunit
MGLVESGVETTDVLLVGGGVASVRCARMLRREGFDGRIVLVGDEPTPPYNRPPLSKELLREGLPDELVLAEPERWYERRGVELRRLQRVVALDAGAREATLDDGTRLRFERCLLATGAAPRTLPVPGGERAILLRTIADARRLRHAAESAGAGAPVVLVGGGFIGLEVASSLRALGLRPTVVELGDALWAGSFGPELSGWAESVLADAGVQVRCGAAVTRVEPAAAWIGDERLEAAFVVAGIGVRPREELALTAGLACDDGILTDASHATSAPGVWAAGDVARVDGVRVEHWHAAREGGERAALAMLGRALPPPRAPWVFSELAGRNIDIVGWVADWDETRRLGNGDFSLAYLRGGAVQQLAIVGGHVPVEEARAAIERGVGPAELARLASTHRPDTW